MKHIYKLFVLMIAISILVAGCGPIAPKTDGDMAETLAALSVQSTVDRAISLTALAGVDSAPTNTPLPTATPTQPSTPTTIPTATSYPTPIQEFSDLQLRTEFGSEDENANLTRDIFAIWWDKKNDFSAEAEELVNKLIAIRKDTLNNFGLYNPPNPIAGYYYNVYLHTQNDNYPDWGMGQGTDIYGTPFLTIPVGSVDSDSAISHEGFHIFQYSANSPGFEYRDNTGWYVEASANWYAAQSNPNDLQSFLTTASIYALPHQKLWRSWENLEPNVPDNWQRAVRQYGLHALLYYLSENEDVPSSTIVGGYYGNTNLSPQEYLSTHIEDYRTKFGSWAAHNAADFDYITREQWDRALFELHDYGQADDMYPYALSLPGTGTDGEWQSPDDILAPRGWAYNLIEVENNGDHHWVFSFEGDELASDNNTPSIFEVRVVTRTSEGFNFYTMVLENGLSGTLEFDTTVQESTIYLVIVSVPDSFQGDHYYQYQFSLNHE